MKKLIALITVFLMGCGSDKISPPEVDINTINVNSDYKLVNYSLNDQFVINSDNIVFDLNGNTIHGTGEFAQIVVRGSNVTIKNGNISSTGFTTAINVSHTLSATDIEPLKQNPSEYEKVLYSRNYNNITIQDVKFDKLKTGVYVSSYASNITIKNSEFTNIDRMAVYLDTGSKLNTITNNKFINVGHRRFENFGRKRGVISIDSSYNNIISENIFDTTGKYNGYPIPEIELYRNCGERSFGTDQPLLRVHGANNNVIERNKFRNSSLAIWFQYREHDNFSVSKCPEQYKDISNNNKAISNILINVTEFVRDDGENNQW